MTTPTSQDAFFVEGNTHPSQAKVLIFADDHEDLEAAKAISDRIDQLIHGRVKTLIAVEGCSQDSNVPADHIILGHVSKLDHIKITGWDTCEAENLIKDIASMQSHFLALMFEITLQVESGSVDHERVFNREKGRFYQFLKQGKIAVDQASGLIAVFLQESVEFASKLKTKEQRQKHLFIIEATVKGLLNSMERSRIERDSSVGWHLLKRNISMIQCIDRHYQTEDCIIIIAGLAHLLFIKSFLNAPFEWLEQLQKEPISQLHQFLADKKFAILIPKTVKSTCEWYPIKPLSKA